MENKLEFFKKSVEMVEIEAFSYCNRKCWFCPNSSIDRFSENIYMNETVYLNILNDLSKIKYDKTISFSRYNEPLADKIILTRLKQANRLLPDAYLHTNTNGDYLTSEYLEQLIDAGLNSLNIQIYLAENEIYSNELIFKKAQKHIESINLPYKIISSLEDEIVKIKFTHPNLALYLQGRNFRKNGVNRGGLIDTIETYNRTEPCFIPRQHIYIDYNANVVPCCNIRSDAETHKAMIMGNLKDNSIFEIFSGENLSKLRTRLAKKGEKPAPCNSCYFLIAESFKW